jgi:sugar lactone lactonase YvrE
MTGFKRLLMFALLLLAAIVAYLLLWPVPISPAAWTPAPAPSFTGNYQQNSRLSPVERLSLGTGFAPEDVAIDAEKRIYAGTDGGRIMRLQPDGTQPEVFADTHGRPLGLIFDRTGDLIVADAD